jgi:hypothetical protein
VAGKDTHVTTHFSRGLERQKAPQDIARIVLDDIWIDIPADLNCWMNALAYHLRIAKQNSTLSTER